ncbi:Replication factor-A carboxy-terminal domain protein [Arachis hypogaea]|nr:Replication factor-A carboxy-terminal domain protein [Arachis hypogaea]
MFQGFTLNCRSISDEIFCAGRSRRVRQVCSSRSWCVRLCGTENAADPLSPKGGGYLQGTPMLKLARLIFHGTALISIGLGCPWIGIVFLELGPFLGFSVDLDRVLCEEVGSLDLKRSIALSVEHPGLDSSTQDKVSLQNVINISRVLINPDMQENVNFLNQYGIASNHFSRLHSNEVGDLVCVIDGKSFDWKLIRTINNLKANNEDGQFFVVGKIKEIVEDPEWWFFSCVCGHPIVGDDNVFHCQLCSREVHHFMISYRIKILVEDGTSSGMFVLLDNPATKLLGRTCSDVFLLLEDEIDDQICFLTGEIIDVLKHQKWWYYCCLCNAPVSHVGNVFYCYLCRVECVDAIRRYRIKINIFHSNGSNIFILDDDESTDDYTVPNGIISQLMNKKIVFIVDPRPVGYELNTSLHVVRAVCDDVEIKFDLDPFVPHFPFEFKNPAQFHSNASIQCSSSSSPTVGQASPISVLNWNCWTVNYDFHARISSSQGLNLFGNHQPLTIREELRSAFGQYENTIEAVERMDECSG